MFIEILPVFISQNPWSWFSSFFRKSHGIFLRFWQCYCWLFPHSKAIAVAENGCPQGNYFLDVILQMQRQ